MMSEHEWFHEHMIVYGAGGLSAEECLRLERHAAECSTCAQDLVRQRLYEAALDRVCAPVHFAADWDERVIETWRKARGPRLRWTAPARWAASIAAVIMLGLLGAGVMTIAEQGWIRFPGNEQAAAGGFKLGVDLTGGTILTYEADTDEGGRKHAYRGYVSGHTHHGANITKEVESAKGQVPDLKDAAQYAPIGFGQRLDGAGGFTASDPEARQFEPFGKIKRNLGVNNVVSGLTPGGTLTSDLNAETHTAVTGGIIGGKLASGGGSAALDKRLDDLQVFYDQAREKKDAGGLSTREVWGHLPQASRSENEKANLTTTTKAAETTASAKEEGAAPRLPVQTNALPELGSIVISGTPPVEETAKRMAELAQVAKETGTAGPAMGFGMPGGGSGGGRMTAGGFAYQPMMPGSVPPTPTPTAPPVTAKPADDAKPGGDRGDGKEGKDIALLKSSTEYHKAPYSVLIVEGDKQRQVRISGSTDQPKPAEGFLGSEKGKQAAGKGTQTDNKTGPDPIADQNKSPIAVAQGNQKNNQKANQEPPPQAAQRKIIRTGELEFEVEAFDNAVADITRLISAIPGAFVATVNSEKLPNGKVRGSVVVRVPPEHLDKFVLDMRRDLTKAGELKSQRIGSQDVTKQYTDIESRLRAARAMEERLINIIKMGKGEIKDLLAAERELGIWRTKIEEMEGELRYYNNQVSLSTLTITAYEKEIRTAAALVVSEHVNMKLETDDVEKALQAALKAVADAKGRVLKSDLTQHTAGQVDAVMQFEVAPAAAPGIKDKLRTLGDVTHHDAQRLQQTENGAAAPAGEPIKSRQSDVRFNVTFYNVANIKPRLTFEMQIAVPEVPVEYGNLLETVTKAKGQIRVSQLDEKDKLNIYAQLDFDVPAGKREDIDKRLAELGDIVTRNTTRAGPGETATDRKVGYRLVLKSFTSIPARETFIRQIAVSDVPGEYGALLSAVAKAKGQLRVSQLNEQDRLNIHAQLDFDVPSGQRETIEKQLAALGEVVSRNTMRAAPNDVATDRKVSYRLTLKSVLSVLPRETYTLTAISLDVADAYRKLHEAIVKAQGHVRAGQLNEQDKQNITAELHFDVPVGERAAIDKLLDEVGEVYSRTTSRAQPGETATDKKVGYRLAMHSRIPPRETVALGLEVKDVDAIAASLADMVTTRGGKVVASQVIQDASGKATAFQLFDVPLSEKDELMRRFKQVGEVRAQKQTQNISAPAGRLATAHIDVTLTNVPPIVPTDEGVWPQIRNSLAFSFRLLSVSLMFVVVGLCVVLPWALVLWVAVKLFRRVRAKPA